MMHIAKEGNVQYVVRERRGTAIASSNDYKNSSVLDRIIILLGPRQRDAVQRIESEEFASILKKTAHELEDRGWVLTSNYLARGELALKQYHVVAVLDPRNEHAISDTLDPFWHSQILHTREYVRFCEDVMGHYIHHQPLDHEDKRAVARLRWLYAHTHRRIVEIFGAVDPEFFPFPIPDSRLVCMHCECHNEGLIQESRYPQVFSCTR
jgi:hypothetical protein